MKRLNHVVTTLLILSAMAMATTTCQLLNPFRIDIDPMQRLLLVNIEKDPDSLYIGFEPQVFDDEINGTGHLVIGWRVDGRVDVYHQPGLRPDPRKYDIAGKGLAHLIEREMRKASFEISDFGVQAEYEFRDMHGRDILITLHEKNPRTRKPFGLLAPMGSAAQKPSSLPLILLHDFYFVRRKDTEIRVSIAGARHEPDRLPLPMDFSAMYFARYSPKPLIATVNPAFYGVLPFLEVGVGQRQVRWGEYEFELDRNGDCTPAIRRIIRNNHIHPIALRFEKPFPDLRSLEEGGSRKGGFVIEGHPSTGWIGGKYAVEKREGLVTITLVPSRGWHPRPTKVSLRFLYTVAAVFRNWPATYAWTARIQQEEDGRYLMQSGWIRN